MIFRINHVRVFIHIYKNLLGNASKLVDVYCVHLYKYTSTDVLLNRSVDLRAQISRSGDPRS